MMEYRWKVVGGKSPLPFKEDAIRVMYEGTKGLPGFIVNVSNSALNRVYAERKKKVDVEDAEYALAEAQLKDKEEEDVE